jgi:mRNA-degrading endonuclease YafQ of YafQ-DinJ toxin-antitoxin module
MEWRVVESRLFAKQFQRSPRNVQQDYGFWRDLVCAFGPNLQGGYRTHALHGRRSGQKSVRLSRQWRVIFRVVEDELIVEALELTPHKY